MLVKGYRWVPHNPNKQNQVFLWANFKWSMPKGHELKVSDCAKTDVFFGDEALWRFVPCSGCPIQNQSTRGYHLDNRFYHNFTMATDVLPAVFTINFNIGFTCDKNGPSTDFCENSIFWLILRKQSVDKGLCTSERNICILFVHLIHFYAAGKEWTAQKFKKHLQTIDGMTWVKQFTTQMMTRFSEEENDFQKIRDKEALFHYLLHSTHKSHCLCYWWHEP